jgi:hypothetical protein
MKIRCQKILNFGISILNSNLNNKWSHKILNLIQIKRLLPILIKTMQIGVQTHQQILKTIIIVKFAIKISIPLNHLIIIEVYIMLQKLIKKALSAPYALK